MDRVGRAHVVDAVVLRPAYARLGRLNAPPSSIALLVLALLVLPPVGSLVFGASRSDGPGAPRAQFTLSNWAYVLQPEALQAIGDSLLLGAVTALLAVLLGTFLAWLIVRTDLPGRRKVADLLIIPLLFSPLLTSMAYVGLIGPNAGIVNAIAKNVFHMSTAPFNAYSVGAMVMVLLLHYTPYVYVAVRSALLNVNGDLEDASRLLGASTLFTIRRVTLPLIRPALLGAAFLVVVFAAEEFNVPATLGRGIGFPTLPYLIYENVAEFPSKPTVASALGLVLLSILLIGFAIYLRMIRSSTRYVTVGGKGGRSSTFELNAVAKTVALAIVAAYFLLAIVLPYGTLLLGSLSTYYATSQFDVSLFTTKHFVGLFGSSAFISAMANTVTLVLVGGVLTTLFAAVLAWIAVRERSRWASAIHVLSSTPILIPGVVLGLGMLWTYVYVRIGLYGTLGILLLAYVTRFVGHGTRIVSGSVAQIGSELEEAAYTLGSTRTRTFRTITLPLLRGPLAASFLLVAVFIALELSASVFLYSGKSMTAAIYIWITMSNGYASPAFAGAVILATFTFVLIAVAQVRLRALERL